VLREGVTVLPPVGQVDPWGEDLQLAPPQPRPHAEDERWIDSGLPAVQWYSAPGWSPPTGGGELPLVAFDEPCALRRRALETPAQHRRPASVVCDAAYLAGVLAAARTGLGVALLATVGRTPEGLVRRTDLPEVLPIPLPVGGRPARAATGARAGAADSIRRVLDAAA
jgi:hypothetical protein